MSLSERSPRILVFAGPNGSGKSTVTLGIPAVGLYINADEIKKSTGCTDLEAAQMAESIRENRLAAKADFTFETVLSTERNLIFLQRAKDVGYQIMAVFVLTHDSDINVMRVQSRVHSGGHDVPADKIRSRYTKSLKNIGRLVRIADITQILDNSGDKPDLICKVNNGTAEIFPSAYWSENEILSLLKE